MKRVGNLCDMFKVLRDKTILMDLSYITDLGLNTTLSGNFRRGLGLVLGIGVRTVSDGE